MFFREKVYHHATSNRSMLEAGVFYYILTLCQACALSLPPSHIFGWGNWGTEEFSKSSVPRLGLCDQNITSSVQSLSSARLFATPWTTAYQASLSITNSRSLLKLMSIESVMPSNHLILCHPLLLPSIFPSIRVFSNESVLCIRWPEYWSFSFNISPSNEHPELMSYGQVETSTKEGRNIYEQSRPFL